MGRKISCFIIILIHFITFSPVHNVQTERKGEEQKENLEKESHLLWRVPSF